MKKIIALIMALVMVMGLAITASAAESGSITITNATIGKTYKLYKMISATVGEGDTIAYSMNSDYWELAITGRRNFADPINSRYFSATNTTDYPVSYHDGDGNVQIGYMTIPANLDDSDFRYDMASKAANTTADAEEVADSSTVVFTGLESGYYLLIGSLDGNADTFATIDTVGKNNVDVIDKNQDGVRNHDKVIVNGNETVEEISYIKGEYLPITLTAKVHAYDGENKVLKYILNDLGDAAEMSYLETMSVSVTPQGGEPISLALNLGYELTCDGNEVGYLDIYCQDFSIEIPWKDEYGAVADITVSYLTNTDNVESGDKNKFTVTSVTGAGSNTTTEEEVTYYQYNFGVEKVDPAGEYLSGAEFVLATGEELAANYSNAIAFTNDNGAEPYYTATTKVTPNAENTKILAGTCTVAGLKAGTYYLHETKAPDGYNKLTAPIVIVIEDDFTGEGATPATANTTVTYPDGTIVESENAVIIEVENNTGSELPSTGGIGTTLFYVIGGLMMTGAAVLLITKKRMSV